MKLAFVIIILLSSTAGMLQAQQPARSAGPVIHSAGEVFTVTSPDFETPADMTWRVAFDVSEAAPTDAAINPGLNTVARFLNMHAQAGTGLDRLHLAVVVHGAAGKDLLLDAAYRDRYGIDNPNTVLLDELARAGVQIILCGQTAASRGLTRPELAKPVALALSAMTAHAVLQERGYHVNPF